MAQDGDDFLRRWSRRKLDAAASAPAPAGAPAGAESPPLPSPDSLTFESDFKAFMHSKVTESVKRAALKKLFSDPHFNVMDGLDIYIDDYSKDDPIPPEMLAGLQHSRTTLFGREEGKKEEKTAVKDEPEVLAQAPAPADEPQQERKKEDDGVAG